MVWYPHVTVATVIENNNRYLLVYEQSDNGFVFNQPAGHLEPGENLQQAAVRETLEETAWDIQLTGFLGVSLYHSRINQVTYVRNTFVGEARKHHPQRSLDTGIETAVWLTFEEILQRENQLRSPLVLKVIQDYRDGKHYPLDLVYEHR